MSILITGHSSGLGKALAESYLNEGEHVCGISRGKLNNNSLNLLQISADLSDLITFKSILNTTKHMILESSKIVFLNAGLLGPIRPMSEISQQDIDLVMNINVWANKIILDWFKENKIAPEQIILMSSGAAISAHYGWGPYALSKSALNTLGKLYSQEMTNTHITSLAPGYVETAMQEKLREVDANLFPSVKPLHDAQDTALMPSAKDTARKIISSLDRLKHYPTGTSHDLRHLD